MSAGLRAPLRITVPYARATRVLFAVLAGTVVAGMLPSISSARPARVGPTVKQLQARESRLVFDIADLQRREAFAEDRFDRVSHTRDIALGRLAQHLVGRYKRGEEGGMIAQVIASGRVGSAVDAARALNDVSSFELRLVNELDAASDQASLERDLAAGYGAKILSSNAELDEVRSQIQLHAAAQATRIEAAEMRRAARKARAAAAANTTLVSSTGSQTSFAGGFGTLDVASVGVLPVSDVTTASLDAYLFSKQSPMAGQAMYIMMSAQRWGLDPRIIIAIAGAESNFGDITCADYNAWGWSCPNSPKVFTSWGDGIEAISEGLRRYYIDEGYTSVARIQTKWAPSGAANDPTGLNNNWVRNVTRFLVEMGGDPNAISFAGGNFGAASLLGA